MSKQLLIDATHAEETRVVIADEAKIYEFDISATNKTQNKGNIYLAKITRVEPSLQAAFVEYGSGRQGFLPFSEIHPDYYQIPVADRKKLIEEVAAAGEEEYEQEDRESVRESKGAHARKGRRGHRRRGRFNESREEVDSGVVDSVEADQATHDQTTQLDENTFAESVDASAVPVYMAEKSVVSQADIIRSEPVEDVFEPVLQIAIDADAPSVAFEEEELVGALLLAPHQEISASGAHLDEEEPQEEERSEEEKPEETGGSETMGDEDEYAMRRKASFLRRYKIQEVIKKGQIVLIQVVKEERGNKGASLSTYISLAGRYCVLMPNSPKTGGISRKISSNEDRRRLKEISEEMRLAEGISAIIRTAGIDRTRAEIRRDYDYLVKLWNQIRELTLTSTAPAIVHEEADIIKRSLRDLYSSDIKDVVVAGEEAYKRARDFMKLIMPSHAARVKQHTDPTPIFYAYDVEDQLQCMHEPHVRLESGGSIVLNPTEALVSIDVNSGRSTTERNVEETALKTNLEAAQEIARQLRLRDLAGLIVIDFIDMFDFKNRRAVERQLKEALKNDRAKIQVGRISAFGLLEMSRQRMRPSLSETNAITCPHCEGKGFVLSPETLGVQHIRLLAREASSEEYTSLKLRVPAPIALYLLNTKRSRLLEVEQTHKVHIAVEIADLLNAAGFILERVTHEGQKSEINGMDSGSFAKRGRTKRKRGRDRDRQNSGRSDSEAPEEALESAENDNLAQMSEPAVMEESADRGTDRDPRRRRGGRRRGGRDRERGERSEGQNNTVLEPEISLTEPETSLVQAEYVEEKAPLRESDPAIVSSVSAEHHAVFVEKEPARKGWWRRIVE